MQEGYTHITLVLDRSGSMNDVKADTIGGYNQFIREQQAVPGKATYSLFQFDDRFEPVQTFVPLSEALILDDNTFKPRGWTRLLDAIGNAMISVGESLEKLPEDQRPEKVVFAVMTDGEENSSREFSHKQINEMITHQEQTYNWQVVFLSSDIKSVETAIKLYGIKRGQTMSYAPTGQGSRDAFCVFSSCLSNYRHGTTSSMDVAEEEKKKKKSTKPTRSGPPRS